MSKKEKDHVRMWEDELEVGEGKWAQELGRGGPKQLGIVGSAKGSRSINRLRPDYKGLKYHCMQNTIVFHVIVEVTGSRPRLLSTET